MKINLSKKYDEDKFVVNNSEYKLLSAIINRPFKHISQHGDRIKIDIKNKVCYIK